MAIKLRSVVESDKDIFFSWINNRSLVLNSSAYYPVSYSDHEKWFDSISSKRKDRVFLVIEEIESQTVIGYCQLLNIEPVHQIAELQIRIGEGTHRGKGYGSDAVSKLLNFGFLDLNLERIYLHVFTSNLQAIRAYEKCNFIKEGVLRSAFFVDGNRQDCLVMSILRSEYES